ncbi:UDP-glucose 4-epimerase GalE [Niveibacterium sp. 24ML]|uniref:UDP-glucose 4-epimerase GalE n=1 Tax=Niveibacterium sp. 24ML TaxID=2985512 RepID=UPI0022703C5C|nr:UDP-glucose 4-epimerase GalE [Niveibacterium sp. 24ML]MCX9156905.1 UDP-glucose 4-epimerase GalE [Niveibacterium sp. 24ML]
MIFVTGGAGYIGSHTCVELLQAGFDVTVYDNFCNSHPEALARVERITGKSVRLVRGDIRDRAALATALRESGADAVVHFAGLKAVGESVEKPLSYYDNNVVGTVRLLEAMAECGVKSLVFSSSATVYGDPQRLPLTEDHPLSATNPYGRTKLVIEEMLRDLERSDPSWRIATLRYFNPVGAHASGLIGEDPQGIPNNLMPFVAQVAIGRREFLNVWGQDYPTPDGTGVRDYIHVVDLALGHLCALERLRRQEGCFAVNLGTGVGYSVLDMVAAFERGSGRPVPYRIAPRRAGDIAACYADPAMAAELLGWRAGRDLDAMCADTWRWQQQNPNGYALPSVGIASPS